MDGRVMMGGPGTTAAVAAGTAPRRVGRPGGGRPGGQLGARLAVAAVIAAAAAVPGLARAQETPRDTPQETPAAAQPAGQAGSAVFIEGDLVRGNTPAGITGPVCVMVNAFKRGEKIVFRVRARDATGAALDDKGLKGIAVQLSDGQTFAAEYRARPPLPVRKAFGLAGPSDYFWSAVWLIPADYPTGSLTYKVVATDLAGHAHTWTPFNDPRSLPAVVPGDVQYTR